MASFETLEKAYWMASLNNLFSPVPSLFFFFLFRDFFSSYLMQSLFHFLLSWTFPPSCLSMHNLRNTPLKHVRVIYIHILSALLHWYIYMIHAHLLGRNHQRLTHLHCRSCIQILCKSCRSKVDLFELMYKFCETV